MSKQQEKQHNDLVSMTLNEIAKTRGDWWPLRFDTRDLGPSSLWLMSSSTVVAPIDMGDLQIAECENFYDAHIDEWKQFVRDKNKKDAARTATFKKPAPMSGRTFGDGGWAEDHSGIHG
jgi:hypothetical protein